MHYNSDNSYLFVNRREIYKFKASNKNVNFPSQFCLGTIPNKFDYIDSEEVSLKRNVYDFQADYNALDKSSNFKHLHIFNRKKQYKIMFGVINKMLIVLLTSIVNVSTIHNVYL